LIISWIKRLVFTGGILGLLFTALAGCKKENEIEIAKEEIKKDTLKTVRNREDYEEAIRNFRVLLKKEPDNVILLVSLGNAYFDIGMFEEAIKYYNMALGIHPENVSVRTDLGTAYRRIGLPDKALQEYKKSLSIDPRHSIARYNMGVVLLWDKKNIDGAIHIWEEVLRIDPYFVLADELKNNINTLKDMKSRGGKL